MIMTNKPTLGKGLAALLGEVNIPHAQQAPQSIDIMTLQPGRNQVSNRTVRHSRR